MTTNKTYFAWSYPAEKFQGAVDTLTTSFAPNWQRMYYAMMHFMALLPSHFPDQDLYNRYQALWASATQFGPLMIGKKIYRGSLENTLRRRRRPTFEKYAEEIVAIRDAIVQRRGTYHMQ